MNHAGLEEMHRWLKASLSYHLPNVGGWKNGHVSRVSDAHSFQSFVREAAVAHQLEPHRQQALTIHRGEIASEVGANQKTVWTKAMGDALEERGPVLPIQDEL